MVQGKTYIYILYRNVTTKYVERNRPVYTAAQLQLLHFHYSEQYLEGDPSPEKQLNL
jgi:hypothetical protein